MLYKNIKKNISFKKHESTKHEKKLLFQGWNNLSTLTPNTSNDIQYFWKKRKRILNPKKNYSKDLKIINLLLYDEKGGLFYIFLVVNPKLNW